MRRLALVAVVALAACGDGRGLELTAPSDTPAVDVTESDVSDATAAITPGESSPTPTAAASVASVASDIALPIELIDIYHLARQLDPAYDPPERPFELADGFGIEPGAAKMWHVQPGRPDETVALAIGALIGVEGPIEDTGDGWVIGEQTGDGTWVAFDAGGRFWFNGFGGATPPPHAGPTCTTTTVPTGGTFLAGGCGDAVGPAVEPIGEEPARSFGDRLLASIGVATADVLTEINVDGGTTVLWIAFAPGGVATDIDWIAQYWGDRLVSLEGPTRPPAVLAEVPTVGTDVITTRLARTMSGDGSTLVPATTVLASAIGPPSDPFIPTIDTAEAANATALTVDGREVAIPAVRVRATFGGMVVLAVADDVLRFLPPPEVGVPTTITTTTTVPDATTPEPPASTTTTP